MRENRKSLLLNLILALSAFAVFFTVISVDNRYTSSDPHGSLLVSDSILTEGTLKLDHFGSKILSKYSNISNKLGHYYYEFPIGTSVVSIPAVYVAKKMGYNIDAIEKKLQIIIAAFVAMCLVLLMARFAELFLPKPTSIFLAIVFWFGSGYASTCGAALWSHDFATLFALSALYLSIKSSLRNDFSKWGFIPIFLFAAYVCRPTLSLLAPFLLLFIFDNDRPAATKSAFLLGVCLLFFVLFSLYEFGKVLPPYYYPGRLGGGNFMLAVWGNLASPARGLIVYSPFILLSWLCYGSATKQWPLKRTWILVAFVWPVVHLVVISRFPHWWAGHSYGPRFMTDVLPGLFLLTIRTWPVSFGTVRARLSGTVMAIAVVFAIFVNTYQGLYNRYTRIWNANPNVDLHSHYIFDWKYPQFLANQEGHERRIAEEQSRE